MEVSCLSLKLKISRLSSLSIYLERGLQKHRFTSLRTDFRKLSKSFYNPTSLFCFTFLLITFRGSLYPTSTKNPFIFPALSKAIGLPSIK